MVRFSAVLMCSLKGKQTLQTPCKHVDEIALCIDSIKNYCRAANKTKKRDYMTHEQRVQCSTKCTAFSHGIPSAVLSESSHSSLVYRFRTASVSMTLPHPTRAMCSMYLGGPHKWQRNTSTATTVLCCRNRILWLVRGALKMREWKMQEWKMQERQSKAIRRKYSKVPDEISASMPTFVGESKFRILIFLHFLDIYSI